LADVDGAAVRRRHIPAGPVHTGRRRALTRKRSAVRCIPDTRIRIMRYCMTGESGL
jgi:hypothetical protein